ncbi:hypothetical protein PGC35_01660 [Psychrobacillus sp. PGGUH221]
MSNPTIVALNTDIARMHQNEARKQVDVATNHGYIASNATNVAQ